MSHVFSTLSVLSLCALLSVTCAQAQQVPKAIAVEEDERPVPKAIPVEPKPATPPTNKPKGPDEDLFDYASMIYDVGS